MIRRVTSSRRLLRKNMYRSPHSRHRASRYKRENKSLAKPFQKKFKEMNGPNIKRKKRPKREVITGFKMAYRYRYYQNQIQNQDIEDDEETEELN